MVCVSMLLEIRYSEQAVGLLEASYDRGRERQRKEMNVIISLWS